MAPKRSIHLEVSHPQPAAAPSKQLVRRPKFLLSFRRAKRETRTQKYCHAGRAAPLRDGAITTGESPPTRSCSQTDQRPGAHAR